MGERILDDTEGEIGTEGSYSPVNTAQDTLIDLGTKKHLSNPSELVAKARVLPCLEDRLAMSRRPKAGDDLLDRLGLKGFGTVEDLADPVGGDTKALGNLLILQAAVFEC